MFHINFLTQVPKEEEFFQTCLLPYDFMLTWKFLIYTAIAIAIVNFVTFLFRFNVCIHIASCCILIIISTVLKLV